MNLEFRKGTLEDSDLFVQFLNEIREGMSRKDWLYLDTPEFVRNMMSDQKMDFWMAMDGKQVAAVFSVLYPGLNSENYGYDLGLSDEELLQVVHMDTAAVHSNYRGMGLQGRMVSLAEKTLFGQGRKILLSTVHPENQYSLNNMVRQGYQIQKCVEKYGSERFILRKNIF